VRAIRTFESPSLALLKSVATQVVAGERGSTHASMAIDADHPLLAGVDRYCEAMSAGAPPPTPNFMATDSASASDPELIAYLTYLHHRRAHARIADDHELEAQLDAQLGRFKFGNPLWQQMFVEYFKYYWQYPHHLGGKPQYRSWRAKEFGNGNTDYGVVEWRLPADATVALVGDIGTGTDVAAAVLLAALRFQPDAILHVGDVYYSGTAFEMEHRFTGLFEAVLRDRRQEVPVFTVPGNHEYFTGAVALLECLDSRRLAPLEDQAQAASYFCLRSEDDGWQFLGLDTGYHGHYMDVPAAAQAAALRELKVPAHPIEDTTRPVDMVYVRPDEEAWHQHHLDTFPGRSVLLSHHQLYSAAQKVGVAQRSAGGKPDPTDPQRAWVNTELWKQFGSRFGNRVAAWFWGHEHNLGIYQGAYRPSDWGTGAPAGTLPLGRCCGHSAIPVQQSEKPYLSLYPVPLERSGLELSLESGWYNRGFQILQLQGAGKPARVTYYQVQGAEPEPLPIYSEAIA